MIINNEHLIIIIIIIQNRIMTSARAYGSVYSGHRFSDKSLNTVSKVSE
jgi:hypothetical protein